MILVLTILFILLLSYYFLSLPREDFDLTAAFVDLATYDEADKYMYG